MPIVELSIRADYGPPRHTLAAGDGRWPPLRREGISHCGQWIELSQHERIWRKRSRRVEGVLMSGSLKTVCDANG
jgi:hypothetical protein